MILINVYKKAFADCMNKQDWVDFTQKKLKRKGFKLNSIISLFMPLKNLADSCLLEKLDNLPKMRVTQWKK